MEMAKNTAEQIEAHKAAEAQWEKESKWPVFEVEIEGDETEWAARPGVNLDDDGEPQPWMAKATATVVLHAKSKDHAGALALRANPEYHTVLKVTEQK